MTPQFLTTHLSRISHEPSLETKAIRKESTSKKTDPAANLYKKKRVQVSDTNIVY